VNRRRAVRNIGLTALATTLGCSKESIAPIVPEDPDEFQGKAWRDGTAKTALEDAGLTIRFSNDPSRRDLDDYMIEVNSIAPPGRDWGWVMEVDGVVFAGSSIQHNHVPMGARWRCYLTERW